MQQGGNAVDAAVATALCQGVYNPQASGVGGGGFIMVKAPNGSVEIIDAREPAPSASSQDMFQGECSSMKLCADSRWAVQSHIITTWLAHHGSELLLMPEHQRPLFVNSPGSLMLQFLLGHLLNKALQQHAAGPVFTSHTTPWSDGSPDKGLLQHLVTRIAAFSHVAASTSSAPGAMSDLWTTRWTPLHHLCARQATTPCLRHVSPRHPAITTAN